MQKELWTHEAHFVVATRLLFEHGFATTMPMMRELIKANNVNMGITNSDTGGYHETLTCFYLENIQKILKSKLPKDQMAAVACVLQSEIIDKNYPLKFYDKGDLFSVNARKEHHKPALQAWFPKTLVGKSISLLSATAEFHQQFKSILNDTTTMHDLIPYFGTSVWTNEMVQERFEKFTAFENGGMAKFYFIETRDTNNIVGQCGFKNIDKKKQEAEFGIILHQDVWGQGVAKECHCLCLKQAFEFVGLQRVNFVTDHSNTKMQRFFNKHGIRRVQNTKSEACEFEILARDWSLLKSKLAK